jgi:biotin-(acetyl-CoA carboxylase) ligase
VRTAESDLVSVSEQQKGRGRQTRLWKQVLTCVGAYRIHGPPPTTAADMASLSDDTLRKVCNSDLHLDRVRTKSTSQILVQIQQTAVQSQRALTLTRQQVTNKERERRILQLTMSEISQTEDSVNVYRGVGKM